jgi:hypothetical protein
MERIFDEVYRIDSVYANKVKTQTSNLRSITGRLQALADSINA